MADAVPQRVRTDEIQASDNSQIAPEEGMGGTEHYHA
jgi:hypothetical protein